jgi:hypothetical protein
VFALVEVDGAGDQLARRLGSRRFVQPGEQRRVVLEDPHDPGAMPASNVTLKRRAAPCLGAVA